MNRDRFINGLLFNFILIFLGVGFLLWISTLGNNDIETKMAFYGKGAGQIVAMVIFTVPFFIVMGAIKEYKPTASKLAVWLVLMIGSQLLISSYIPLIVQTYQNAGSTVGEIIINNK